PLLCITAFVGLAAPKSRADQGNDGLEQVQIRHATIKKGMTAKQVESLAGKPDRVDLNAGHGDKKAIKHEYDASLFVTVLVFVPEKSEMVLVGIYIFGD